MFQEATSFDQNINTKEVSVDNKKYQAWDLSNAKDIRYMFYDAKKFNQDISNWNMSNVEYIRSMFEGTTNFNQDISNWKLNKIKNYYYFAPNLKKECKPKLNFKKKRKRIKRSWRI
ncbi:PARCEL domain protein [Mycoplasma leachii PG50]|uniref:PARCEL domain protein n=1 Tax=Mycoplasma leachii (strain DSM 21131 / NCTC 10133 / N29 / PG50) TaxID=880447 RepID=E4PUP0_MYCLG|nr:BspA family leucine-rich repeat surface protein [Mycoplasma leachii]ADR23870.1 PARCEL domain protein [Mycoplasma leachii PG50]